MTEEVTDAMRAAGMEAVESGSVSMAEIEQIFLAMEAARIPAVPDDVERGNLRDAIAVRLHDYRNSEVSAWDLADRILELPALSAIPIPAPTSLKVEPGDWRGMLDHPAFALAALTQRSP